MSADDMTLQAAGIAGERRTRAWVHPHISFERLSLGAVVLLSAILNFVALGSEGYANTYYAAAVKSMLQSWHNFFFVAFDPAGFVAVDKPPLGLWLQAASAKLLGFSGVSLLLPQGLAAVLSVIVLYLLIARRFGHGAGLLASLVLALTPVAVVDNRNNTSDSVLILVLLLSAWAVTRAMETGRLRWLFLGAALMGLGFNVKEMQAFLVLPSLFLLYLAGAQRSLPSRLRHLLLAGVVTLVVSFSWIVAVDLTPASQRPYVSDSGSNSELSLALGYNGLGRLATGLLGHLPSIPVLHVKIDGSIVPGISMEIGNPGLLRLFRPEIGSQASWLLLIALVGLLVAFLRPHSRVNLRRERADLLFWGSWLLAAGWFFSVARFYHLYYLIMLAPPVAALTGIGLSRLWADYRNSITAARPTVWQGWLLPLTLLAGGWAQAHILAGYTTWNAWLGPVIEVSCVLVAAVLVLGRVGLRLAFAPDLIVHFDARTTLAVTLLGVVSLLAGPTAFAAESIANGNGAAWLPQAGPGTGPGFGTGRPGGFRGAGGAQPGGPSAGASGFPPPSQGAGAQPPGTGSLQSGPGAAQGARPSGIGARRFGPGGGFGGGGGAITFAGSNTPTLDSGLITYLEKHRGSARYLVATPTSTYASLFILQTGQPVMTLGGYQGWDKILTLAQLKWLVANGTIRFFLLNGSGSSMGPPGGNIPGGVDAGLSSVNDRLVSWVGSTCSVVPAGKYTTTARRSAATSTGGPGGGFGSQGAGQLYDCGAAT
jgi:4-amino-4-deoxy-L-arabinose transferase-like glycosyltransferase